MESERSLKDDSQEKRKEWSAVKTRATPDKALEFCPPHAKPDPKPGGGCGCENNLKVVIFCYLYCYRKRKQEHVGRSLSIFVRLTCFWLHTSIKYINLIKIISSCRKVKRRFIYNE